MVCRHWSCWDLTSSRELLFLQVVQVLSIDFMGLIWFWDIGPVENLPILFGETMRYSAEILEPCSFWRVYVVTFGILFLCRVYVVTFGILFLCRVYAVTSGILFLCRVYAVTFGTLFFCRVYQSTRPWKCIDSNSPVTFWGLFVGNQSIWRDLMLETRRFGPLEMY